jgi:hypothetical protein
MTPSTIPLIVHQLSADMEEADAILARMELALDPSHPTRLEVRALRANLAGCLHRFEATVRAGLEPEDREACLGRIPDGQEPTDDGSLPPS